MFSFLNLNPLLFKGINAMFFNFKDIEATARAQAKAESEDQDPNFLPYNGPRDFTNKPLVISYKKALAGVGPNDIIDV